MDIIRHKLVVHNRYCKVLGFPIGMEFQKEFLFDNRLVGLHWSFILVRAFFVQFARRHASDLKMGMARAARWTIAHSHRADGGENILDVF